jgi:hypothetical protein
MTGRLPINRTMAVLAIGALTCVFCQNPIADDSPVTLDTIINSWKAREEKVQSFDFRWWSKHFESASYPAISVQPINKPKENATFILRYRFCGDCKGRMRLECKGRDWDQSRGEYISQTTTEILDGEHWVSFSPDGPVGYPYATIDNIKMPRQIPSNWNTLPLLISFRPITVPAAAYGTWKLRSSKDGGVLTRVAGQDRIVEFDRAKDFLPFRCTSTDRDGRRDEVQIEYANDERHEWFPRSWTLRITDKAGSLLASDEGTVIQHSINEPIEDSEFKLDLPVGTLVQDIPATGNAYILRANGRKQPVPPVEFNLDIYRQLLEIEQDAK